jgi:hypothetical protein
MKFCCSDFVDLSVITLKLSIFEPQHIAILLHCSLQPIVEPCVRVGLNFDRNIHFHART